jgi:hypothetical protein
VDEIDHRGMERLAPLVAETAMFLASAPPAPSGQHETALLTPNGSIPDGQR